MKKYKVPIFLWLLFEAVALALWLSLDNLFYLFNFTYIGTALAVGVSLYIAGFKYARMTVQLAVGLYILVYLGVISRENMQMSFSSPGCSPPIGKTSCLSASLPAMCFTTPSALYWRSRSKTTAPFANMSAPLPFF